MVCVSALSCVCLEIEIIVYTYRMALTSGELLCSPAGFIGLIGFELEILLVTFTGTGTGLRSLSMVATGTWKIG